MITSRWYLFRYGWSSENVLPYTLGLAAVVGVLILVFVVWMSMRTYNQSISSSYSKMSDRDLLLFLDSQLDKIADKKSVSEAFGITKTVAARRLSLLHRNGMLGILYNTTMTRMSYTLNKPIQNDYNVKMSDEPFMTIEDLLTIFKHFDYYVSLQELCLATGLPIKVIKREMKYFEDQKIVKIMLQMHAQSSYQRRYVLNEPYRSDPDSYLELSEANFELREIYEKLSNQDYV